MSKVVIFILSLLVMMTFAAVPENGKIYTAFDEFTGDTTIQMSIHINGGFLKGSLQETEKIVR